MFGRNTMIRVHSLAGYAGDVWYPEPAPLDIPGDIYQTMQWCTITLGQL
jgi:hypothetical protein